MAKFGIVTHDRGSCFWLVSNAPSRRAVASALKRFRNPQTMPTRFGLQWPISACHNLWAYFCGSATYPSHWAGAGPRRWKFLRIHTVWSRTTKFGMVTHLWKRFDAAAALEGRTPAFPRSWNPIRPHEMTEPRTLHGDQSWWQENFYRVDHAMLLDDVLQRLLMFIDTKYTLLRK